MKWTLLVLALLIGSAGTSRAQVFRPRGKGPIVHKAEPAKAVEAKKAEPARFIAVDTKHSADDTVATRKVKTPKSRVASDSRPDDLTPDTTPKKQPKKKVQAKRKKGGDDDVQVTDDADDDVKVTDD